MSAPLVGNQAAYARYCGLHPTTISANVRKGKIVFTDDGKVDFLATDELIRSTRLKTGPKRAPEPEKRELIEGIDYEEGSGDAWRIHRCNKLKYDAERSRLDAEVKAASLISRDDVRFFVDDIFLTFTTAINTLQSQLGPRIAPITDINEVNEIIGDVQDAIIESVRRVIESGIK